MRSLKIGSKTWVKRLKLGSNVRHLLILNTGILEILEILDWTRIPNPGLDWTGLAHHHP